MTKYVLGVPLVSFAIRFADVKIQQIDGVPAQFDDVGNLLGLLCVLCIGLALYYAVCLAMELLPYFAESRQAASVEEVPGAVSSGPQLADQALIRNYDAQAFLGIVLFIFEGLAPALIALCVGGVLLFDLVGIFHLSTPANATSTPSQYVVIINQK
ncbi:MAG: hypothetical protein AB1542_09035 [Pseudomonadota bacterium]